MKAYSAVLFCAAVMLAFAGGWRLGGPGQPAAACPDAVMPLFSPGAEAEIAHLIESANSSLDVEMYQFSYTPFADGLIDAQKRGVRVRVLLEPRLDGDDNLNMMGYLRENGVGARWATLEFARTHSKTMAVDGKKVLVGSPNWSYSAMFRNRESAVVVEGRDVAAKFEEVFEEDWAKARAG
jgi:phosphatidylserine/phosphatidylglycerophosphate/cardiolipin synthase-like enzyme